jgi:hypothetical protein
MYPSWRLAFLGAQNTAALQRAQGGLRLSQKQIQLLPQNRTVEQIL